MARKLPRTEISGKLANVSPVTTIHFGDKRMAYHQKIKNYHRDFSRNELKLIRDLLPRNNIKLSDDNQMLYKSIFTKLDAMIDYIDPEAVERREKNKKERTEKRALLDWLHGSRAK